jgi:hypothetical protein
MIDEAGNIHVDLRVDECNRTLFTAHTDTCTGSRGFENTIVKSDTHYTSDGTDVLGADDGAGIAILYGLIQAGFPAYYIFTRQEECGGIGGAYIVEEMPELLLEFDRAIAFDRKGTSDVIYRMSVGHTSTLGFAEEMSEALNRLGMLYMPSDRGSFTDVATWSEYIPDCVNISCGYANEHSGNESLDIAHFQALAECVLHIDWDALPVSAMEIKAGKGLIGPLSDEYKAWIAYLEGDGYDESPFDIATCRGLALTGNPNPLILMAMDESFGNLSDVQYPGLITPEFLLSLNWAYMNEVFLKIADRACNGVEV